MDDMTTEKKLQKTETACRALESIGWPFSEESIVTLIVGLLHLAVQEQIDPRQVVARATLQFHDN
jgi:hypothetical protein